MASLASIFEQLASIGTLTAAVAVVLLIIALYWGHRSRLEHRRIASGCCSACGYRTSERGEVGRCAECGHLLQTALVDLANRRLRRRYWACVFFAAIAGGLSFAGVVIERTMMPVLPDQWLLAIRGEVLPFATSTRDLAATELATRAAFDTISVQGAVAVWRERAEFLISESAMVVARWPLDGDDGRLEIQLRVPPWPSEPRPSPVTLLIRSSTGDVVARRVLVADPFRRALVGSRGSIQLPTPEPDLFRVHKELIKDGVVLLSLEFEDGEVAWKSAPVRVLIMAK